MKSLIPTTLTALTMCVAAAPASAVMVNWTDWVSSASTTSAAGTLDIGGSSVDVTYSATSPYAFFQSGVGTNFFSEDTPAPFTGNSVNDVPSGQDPVENAPTAAEMIALSAAGTVTLSFSETVQDLYFALVSWNAQQPSVIDFGHDVILVSEGDGFWGNGSVSVNAAGTGIDPSGEYHGVIKILGSYDSLQFTHVTENWHGFTVGVAGLAPPPPPPPPSVPEPDTLALLAFSGLALAAVRRRRQQ